MDNNQLGEEPWMQQRLTTTFNNLYQPQNCFFCDFQNNNLMEVVISALYCKHQMQQKMKPPNSVIDSIINEDFCEPFLKFNEQKIVDDDAEYLKRMYFREEYEFKIQNLSEYYRYHRDQPRFYGLPISITLNRYHDTLRELQYKKIKKILKEEQNITLYDESYENSSNDNNNSRYTKKSKYSTLLNQLKREFEEQDATKKQTLLKSESILLYEFCKNIDGSSNGKNLLDFSTNVLDFSNSSRYHFEEWMKTEYLKKIRSKMKVPEKHNFKKVKKLESTTQAEKSSKYMSDKKVKDPKNDSIRESVKGTQINKDIILNNTGYKKVKKTIIQEFKFTNLGQFSMTPKNSNSNLKKYNSTQPKYQLTHKIYSEDLVSTHQKRTSLSSKKVDLKVRSKSNHKIIVRIKPHENPIIADGKAVSDKNQKIKQKSKSVPTMKKSLDLFSQPSREFKIKQRKPIKQVIPQPIQNPIQKNSKHVIVDELIHKKIHINPSKIYSKIKEIIL